MSVELGLGDDNEECFNLYKINQFLKLVYLYNIRIRLNSSQ